MTDPQTEIRRQMAMLNEAQANAVDLIIGGWEDDSGSFILPIIDGPPGTGKTTVGMLGGGLYALEDNRAQICYLAYTNLAADRALEGFVEFGFSPDEVLRIVDATRGRQYENNPYYLGFNRFADLSPNQQRRLKNIPILIGTVSGGARRIISDIQTRPLIIIDEFSQISPDQFFSLLRLTQQRLPSGYILLGDPNQLPVITSQTVLRPNIGIYIRTRKNNRSQELAIQYRMNRQICNGVNALRRALNAYPLITHESVENQTLTTLGYSWDQSACREELLEVLNPDNPFVIVDTDSLSGVEDVAFTGSKYYSNEAQLAAIIGTNLYHSYNQGTEHLNPSILTPYGAQLGAINSVLPDDGSNIRCHTIYSAQGREYPAVVVSFVRKNPGRWIGFLSDPYLRSQTYVACSRGKCKLIALLSLSTFRGHRDFDFLISEAETSGLILTADDTWVR